MSLPEVKITPAENDGYNARTTTVELQLDDESVNITSWTSRIEQLEGTRAVKITFYAHANIDPSGKLLIDAVEEFKDGPAVHVEL